MPEGTAISAISVPCQVFTSYIPVFGEGETRGWLLATVNTKIIFGFIDQIPIVMKMDNPLDQGSASLEEYRSEKMRLEHFVTREHIMPSRRGGSISHAASSRQDQEENSLGQEADEGRCRCSDSRVGLALFIWPRVS
jgi:hypothetical protein